jgi:hypothetical protein
LPVDDASQRGERTSPVVRLRLDDHALELLRKLRIVFGAHCVEHRMGVEPRVPHIEIPHGRELLHRLAVRADYAEHSLRTIGIGEGAVPRSDLEAGGKALDVPVERAGKRLVEIVEIEHQIALRRREPTEVQQMCIPGELRAKRGCRCGREVVRHHGRCAAEERER